MDIRLAVGFCDHPKTHKLQRRAGAEAVVCLLRLWLWARVNRPDGVLTGLDQEDIEIAAGWNGEPGVFVGAILDVGFLDKNAEIATLHNWDEHQGWSCGQTRRINAARKAALARWHKQTDADAERAQCGGNADAANRICGRNAPSPSPSPNIKPKASTPLRSVDACPEPSQAKTPAPAASGAQAADSADLPPSNSQPGVLFLPTNRSGHEYPVTQGQVTEWAELYPAVDVMTELRKMRGWLLANQTRRKTARGMPRFVTNWLAKEQDRGGAQARASPPAGVIGRGKGLAVAMEKLTEREQKAVIHHELERSEDNHGKNIRALPSKR